MTQKEEFAVIVNLVFCEVLIDSSECNPVSDKRLTSY